MTCCPPLALKWNTKTEISFKDKSRCLSCFLYIQNQTANKIYILHTACIVWLNHWWFRKKSDYLTWQNGVLISTFLCNLKHWTYSKILMNWKVLFWGLTLTYFKCTEVNVYVVSKYIILELLPSCWKRSSSALKIIFGYHIAPLSSCK